MDVGVVRWAKWWGTLVVGLSLVAVGLFGYIHVHGEIAWYHTDVTGAREAMSQDLGDYVRVEGAVANNSSRDVIIVEERVTKAVWEDEEYNYTVDWIYVTGDDGESVLVLFDHVATTKPGRHDGDYRVGDRVCIGGTVAVDGGLKALRADFVAKHPRDTSARFAPYHLAAALGGMLCCLTFVLARMFVEPKRTEGVDWRAT